MEEIEVNLSNSNGSLEINRTLAIHSNQELIKLNQYNEIKDNLGKIILNAMYSVGICTNADLCNAIFYEFLNSIEEFKKVFGYPMFITDKNGNKLLNSAELLLDIYLC